MNELSNLGRFLVIIGLTVTGLGLLLSLLGKVSWIGRLPGDIYIQKKNFSFYFPLATSILLSAVISLILWILRKR
ncbi:MAG: DUF2905 domain-containing protein [Candidatus Omnitrophota bacterium]